MTVQEAINQVNDAENRTNRAFGDMKNAGVDMTRRVLGEAKANTIKQTVIPLIACLVGVVLWMFAIGFGFFFIVGGAVIARGNYKGAKHAEQEIESACNILANQLNNSNL